MQRRAETDHAFLVQIWNPRGTEGINAGSGLAAVFTDSPEGPAGTALQTSNEDSKPGLEPLTPGHSSQLEGGPQKTIMLRDKDGKVSNLSSVCQRLFLPQDHQVPVPFLTPSTAPACNAHLLLICFLSIICVGGLSGSSSRQ